MQKILSQLNQLKDKPDAKDINLNFLRALPSSWSQVALTLKTKGGLECLSFDDLYYKLKTLEVDVKGYSTFSSSQSAGPRHSAFVSATSTSKKMSYGDSLNYSLTTTYSVPSNSKTGSHRFGNKARRNIDFDKKESARFNKKKVRYFKCQQSGHFARECRANRGNDKQRYSSFKIKEIGKKEEDSKALITVDTLVDWINHDTRRNIDFDKKESARFNKKKVRYFKCQQSSHFARECRANRGNDKQRYSSFKIKEIGKKEEDSKALITIDTLVDWINHDSESDGVITAKEFDEIKEGVGKLYNLITGANSEEANTTCATREFALMGVTSEETPFSAIEDEGFFDSGCSRSMTGTQRATTNSAGTQDADSNSDCDEQVIIVPSYPSHNIQATQPIDTPSDKVDDSPFPSADEIFQKELARLKGEEQQGTSYADSPALGIENNAKDLQTPASANPVPTVPAAATMVPTDDVLVHTSSSTDSIFDGEPTTRFPYPSDLGNHNPSPGIFSSSSYDD
nr:hypothetical protein [Tanacetum cinerariifolium]